MRWEWLFVFLAFVALSGFHAESAQAQDELDRARELVDKAEPFSKKAGNPDLSPTDRKKARRQAYDFLIQARGIYDAWLDANPGQEETMDAEYCRMASMLFWVKKMASANEFGTPKRKLSGRKPKPKTDPPKTDPPKTDPQDTGSSAGSETVEPPVDPRQQMAESARIAWEQLQELERQNPGDVPRLHAAYEQFLVDHPDSSLPEYTRAAMRLGQLADRLKGVFKQEMGTDPEAHPDMKRSIDSQNVLAVVAGLSRDLKSSQPREVRLRATQLLGQLGSGAGSFMLAKALRDPDAEIRETAQQGLIAIGGDRAAFNIVKLYRNVKKEERQQAALDVLIGVARKGDVDAWTMSPYIGRFVLSNYDSVAGGALDFLVSLGPAGGPGLVEGLKTKLPKKKIELIRGIGQAKYYKGATVIGGYLILGDGRKLETYRRTAQEALKAMGPRCVPYLLPRLKGKRTKMWTAMTLALPEITGVQYGSKGAKRWRKWYEDWERDNP